MSSVNSTNPNAPRREYVAIQAFNNDLFTYTVETTWNGGGYTTTGSLTPVAGGNSTNCPYGRILRENGKKLYPNANPGVLTYMVGVYDSVTFFNGYINPNSPVFQPMNTDKPTYLADGVDGGLYDGTSNIGPGVYTAGAIVSTGPDGYIGLGPCVSGPTGLRGEIYYSGNSIVIEAGSCNAPNGSAQLKSDGTISATSTIIANSSIRGYNLNATSSITAGTNITANSTISGYRFLMNNGAVVGNVAIGATGAPGVTFVGDFKKQAVSTSAITANSVVFLTYSGQNGVGALSAESITAGTGFLIVSNNKADLGTVNYLIIN